MILQIFYTIFPILLISSLGYIYAKKTNISMEMTNKINLDIFIPVLVFYALSEKLPSIKILGTFSIGALIVVLGSGLLLYPIVKLLKINPTTFLPNMMFGNSVNLGLPLALFAFGQEAMALFIALSLVQIIGQFTLGTLLYGGKSNPFDLLKNPVIIATILGLSFNYLDLHLPQFMLPAVKMIADVSIPLVIFALGVRLTHVELKYWKVGLIGAVLSPTAGVITAFIAISIFDYTQLQTSLLILFSVLPPAVLNAIMAERYNNDSTMVASVVAIGTISSLIVIPITLYFLY